MSGIVKRMNLLEDDIQIFLGAAHYYMTVEHEEMDSAIKGFELGTITNHIVHTRHYMENTDLTPWEDLDVVFLGEEW